ncbi:hypothetical protein [Okeania sp. KiyG1]|uniref:hypothetical protein n=1 Tax=Okeania sp. KiyG1 TaxID=2720165 RepID=UPI0019217967|nr:hypothetical protein [Okeania sp. KiyG1]
MASIGQINIENDCLEKIEVRQFFPPRLTLCILVLYFFTEKLWVCASPFKGIKSGREMDGLPNHI